MPSTRTYIRNDEWRAEMLLDSLTHLYERGWEPADVLHITARVSDAADVPLAAAAVLFDARHTRASHRAPTVWVEQIHTIRDRHPAVAPLLTYEASFEECLARTLPGVSRFEVDGLAYTWKYLPRFMHLVPPPSQWPRARLVPDDTAPGTSDPRILGRIRGLLSKAEATDFVDEAEAFTAKAQELMTRYSVDEALLADSSGAATDVRARRLHLHNPYVREKVLLLTAIGDANRVRTVWFTRVQIATIVGAAVDLRQVEMLFTSLLIQSTRAVRAADTHGRKGGAATGFRRAFLAGFAARIGERLREADARATSAAAADAHIPVTTLAPVLARRRDEVDSEFRRLFPTTRSSRSRGVDEDGFHAGRAAADHASLGDDSRTVAQ